MLGNAIREARLRKNLTQARLARLAGVSRRHLAALEKGANVSVNVLKKVATVLELQQIELGDLSLKSGDSDNQINVALITDAIREARADAVRTQAMLARAEGLLGKTGSVVGAELAVAFPTMPVRHLDRAPGVSADMIRDAGGPDWLEVKLAGELRQGEPLDESKDEIVSLPQSLMEEGEIVFRVRGDGLRDQGMNDGDLLIVEPRPRGRASNGEIVIGRIGKNIFIGRWWQKHGQRALMSNGLAEVTVGRSARSLKVVAVVNQIVRPAP
ncbi:MAG TPA: helix-turn-helix domain-containing protein [Thermoanaerobaculia bacterium]